MTTVYGRHITNIVFSGPEAMNSRIELTLKFEVCRHIDGFMQKNYTQLVREISPRRAGVAQVYIGTEYFVWHSVHLFA